MNCAQVKRFLNRYIDKEIEDKELIALVDEHIKNCPHCQTELDTMISMKNFITQKERISAEEDFLVNLKKKLEGEAPIINIKWLPQAGELARRLIPVPVISMIVMFVLVFSQLNGLTSIDEYLYADLSNEELAVLGGYIDSSDLLTQGNFNNNGGDLR